VTVAYPGTYRIGDDGTTVTVAERAVRDGETVRVGG
jgi:hypothetical protein